MTRGQGGVTADLGSQVTGVMSACLITMGSQLMVARRVTVMLEAPAVCLVTS